MQRPETGFFLFWAGYTVSKSRKSRQKVPVPAGGAESGMLKLDPVIPFEPVPADRIPAGPGWTAQIKWDGVRVLACLDGRGFRLYNRKGRERTLQYPELHDPSSWCSASSFLVDGEMIAFDRSKPSFHEIMKRDGLRRPERVREAARRIPVVYMAFDVLFCDGRWVTDRPLAERQELLASMLKPHPSVRLVGNEPDARALLAVMEAHGMEGIVCKRLDSAYAIGGKDGRWRKLKVSRELTAVAGGIASGEGGTGSLLLGLFDPEGRLVYIGRAGPGRIALAEWRRLLREAAALAVPASPFPGAELRRGRETGRGVTWLRPELTVRVRFQEWTPYGTMRQPVILAVADAAPGACTTAQSAGPSGFVSGRYPEEADPAKPRQAEPHPAANGETENSEESRRPTEPPRPMEDE